ncbi:MAG: calcium-binding protein, partial [Planctomycetota bacterium]
FSGNTAGEQGGGIWSQDVLIGNQDGEGSLTVTQSTITGNTATNGGGGMAGLTSDVYANAVMPVDAELNNVIVAGNRFDSVTASDIQSATATEGINATGANNLIGDTNSAGGLVDGTDGNIVGNSGVGTVDINTILDTNLTDNGGPTPTHLLVDGSPAIDAGDDALAVDTNGDALATDQRGEARFSGAVDIGSVEIDAQISPGVTVIDGTLTITGTEDDDHVLVTKLWGKYFIYTNIDGATFAKITASTVDNIAVDVGAGNDRVVMGLFVRVPTLIRGGEGDDRLYGGLGSDIILGGAGDDRISGSWGNDLLVGGTGSDKITGRAGKDILVGGSTTIDDDNEALNAVMSAWNAGDPIDDLFDVVDDEERDKLYGSWGRDRIFDGVGDWKRRW